MRQVGERDGLYVGLLEFNEFERYWPNIRQELERMPWLWSEVATLEVIHQWVEFGMLEVWIAGDGTHLHLVFMSQVVTLPNGEREFQIRLCFGVQLPRYWRLVVETFEDVAIKLGCRTLMVETQRDGFQKLLFDEGYHSRVVQMSRVLGTPKGVVAN